MVGVRVTPSVQSTSPTLTVTWQAVAGEAVNYTVKYSTQPGGVNTPPEGALEVKGISGTSTILTALERGTTYYIWVVGVSEGGERPHSDRMSGVTYDSELENTILALRTKDTLTEYIVEHSRSKGQIIMHDTFRPQGSSSATKRKCKEIMWLIYSKLLS